ncbi:MAG: hypothetical protein IIV92_04175 [Schwartzia sp.]|nr:hypothetical protein [Schwartzia sp. (in: firmicutes)]
MATIKDYKKGLTVFAVRKHDRNGHCKEIVEAEVIGTGRVYVSVVWKGQNYVRKYRESELYDYFREQINYGYASYLFLTRQAAEEYCEREELVTWAWKELTHSKISELNLKQLRGIKQAIEDK